MQLSEKNYNLAKWIVTIVLPAFGAFYAGLAQLVGAPYGLEVVGVTSLLAVFLGAVLGVSNANYKKANEAHAGFITPTGTDPVTGHPDLAMTITKDPAELVNKDSITFKVGQPPA